MSERMEVADGGILVHDPDFLGRQEADELLQELKFATPWRQEVTAWGRPFPRLTAWYADEGLTYRYSGVTHHGLAWTASLAGLRRRVEGAAGGVFNSLLLNYYRDGRDSVGFHADDEPELGPNPVVPSVSLGGTRRFVLRHNRSGQRLHFDLTHGSLLVMAGTLQHHWKHTLPRASGPVGERINLTFRRIVGREPHATPTQGASSPDRGGRGRGIR
jgi:alkylated DNA repair dioxygenase AlkB